MGLVVECHMMLGRMTVRGRALHPYLLRAMRGTTRVAFLMSRVMWRWMPKARRRH
jgi:hypothetical protein